MRDAMTTRMSLLLATVGLALAVAQQPASADDGEWSGEVGLEGRLFLSDPVDPRQHGDSLSLYVQPEWYRDFDDGDQRVVFSPYLRLDSGDPQRSHGDLREFYWRKSFEDAELYVGLRKIYWGVTESLHLVDVINQSDFVDNLDAEDKLGQPMVSATFLLLAGVGIVRMPDLYTRIAASTKAIAFGGGLMFVAVAVQFEDLAAEIRALAGVGFLMATASITAHVVGRAALHVGIPFTSGTDQSSVDRRDAGESRP